MGAPSTLSYIASMSTTDSMTCSATPATLDRVAQPRLTERRRLQTRLDIAEAALRIFEQVGYEAANFEAIAEEAGVSARTVYRYFGAKDELLGPIVATGTAELADRLAERPDDEELADAVLRAYEDVGRSNSCLTESSLIALMIRVPALRARWLDDLRLVEQALAQAIRERTGGQLTVVQSQLTAGVVVTALRTALEHAAPTGDGPSMVREDFASALAYLRDGAGLRSPAAVGTPSESRTG